MTLLSEKLFGEMGCEILVFALIFSGKQNPPYFLTQKYDIYHCEMITYNITLERIFMSYF